MEIPSQIKTAAASYLRLLPGSKIVYLGEYGGGTAFYVRFPEKMKVGYPPAFILKSGKVTEINGEDALDLISSFS